MNTWSELGLKARIARTEKLVNKKFWQQNDESDYFDYDYINQVWKLWRDFFALTKHARRCEDCVLIKLE